MSTPEDSSPLNNLQVAAQCQMPWSDMQGDDRVRHCQSCKLNVYNISELSTTEAENLINASEGKLCVRFFRRKDGTILTNNCPSGIRTLQRRMYAKLAAIFGASFISAVYILQNFFYCQPIQGSIAVQAPANDGSKVKVVCAVKNIQAGSAIHAEDLEEIEINLNKRPSEAIDTCSFAVGTVAKHEIICGRAISTHDLIIVDNKRPEKKETVNK